MTQIFEATGRDVVKAETALREIFPEQFDMSVRVFQSRSLTRSLFSSEGGEAPPPRLPKPEPARALPPLGRRPCPRRVSAAWVAWVVWAASAGA